MFSATEFIYDGIACSEYGLKIASLNDNTVEEKQYYAPNVVTVKSSKNKKFHWVENNYESPPSFELSVLSELPLDNYNLREIINWLDSKKGFRPLIFIEDGIENLEYKCIFTISSIIYHSGHAIGFNLIATCESLYAKGGEIKLSFDSASSGTQTFKFIINYDSDIIDEYIYPVIEFELKNGSAGMNIKNESDDTTRIFSFDGLDPDCLYKIDNENKIITGSGVDILSKFSKKWFRIINGKNIITGEINGKITIYIPKYYRIKFN